MRKKFQKFIFTIASTCIAWGWDQVFGVSTMTSSIVSYILGD
jgi:hypothetical protein